MLKQRILTAAVLAPLVLAGLFATNAWQFALFCGVLVSLGAWEWARMSGCQVLGQVVFPAFIALMLYGSFWQLDLLHQALWLGAAWWLVALVLVLSYPKTSSWWACSSRRLIMGALVLVPAWAGLILLRELGWQWLLYVLLIAWVADIGAYFAGRKWGKRKLAPQVSPGKSWEGVIGGMVGTAILSLLFALFLNLSFANLLSLLVITLGVTLVSVLGDLTESMLKRTSGMKDSSNLLPGHGGVMDRIDSLTAAIPVFTLLLLHLGSWL